MVAAKLKQIGKSFLLHAPWVWEVLRVYVRYSPRILVWSPINEKVNWFYLEKNRRFVARTRFGCWIAGDTRDLVQRYIFLYGLWEPSLTHWLIGRLQPGDVFVDVGANIGYYSLMAGSVVGNTGGVVSIEASPTIYRQLCANVSLNRGNNIRTLHCAAADVDGTLRLFRAHASNLGATSMYADDGYEDEGIIGAWPLHALLTSAEIRRTRLIKIDVEGAEVSVVKGLLALLAQAPSDIEIVIEVGGGPKSAPSAAEATLAIVPLFAQAGFNVYRITNDYHPRAYAQPDPLAHPRRVSSATDIVEECDLIFSRRDAAWL